MRFDEVELQAVPLGNEEAVAVAPPPPAASHPLFRRLLALLTDLSLFAALALALSPLLPQSYGWLDLTALGGFVLVVSYYYFVGAWMLWGKTIGGTIFDVRVVSRTLREATKRWAWTVAGVTIAGATLTAVIR